MSALFRTSILSSLLLAISMAYDMNPTLPPIGHSYNLEAFIGYLRLEQTGYPQVRTTDLTDYTALDCISNRLVAILPSVQFNDIFWNTSTFHTTTGIWNSEETTYLQFEVNYVPEALAFWALPHSHETYNNKGTLNPGYNGFNGNTKQDPNCQDCWDKPDTVYLQLKDIITQYVTSTQFVKDMTSSSVVGSTCAAEFSLLTYAFVSFSQPADELVVVPASRKHDNWGLQYLWILVALIIPVGYYLYSVYTERGVDVTVASKYEQDKQLEMADTTSSNNNKEEDAGQV